MSYQIKNDYAERGNARSDKYENVVEPTERQRKIEAECKRKAIRNYNRPEKQD